MSLSGLVAHCGHLNDPPLAPGRGGLTLIKVAAVRGAGLRLEPTGRNPRHYTVGFDDLDQGIAALVGCSRQVVPNLYYAASPGCLGGDAMDPEIDLVADL